MQIGIIGKGGAGKSSVSWMVMQAALAAGWDVWGLDADYNQHLARMFGVDNKTIPACADHMPSLIDHVIGARSDITRDKFDKTTLPTAQSRLLRLDVTDEWLKDKIVSPAENLHLMRVGDFDPEDKGLRCYHVRTAVADILLSHLLAPKDRQLFVVDFTAGVDPFASPVYLKLDALVLVVEPTLKGVEVARQWQHLLADAPIPLLIVGNKATGDEDVQWLCGTLQPQKPTIVLQQDPAIRRGERGELLQWTDLLQSNRDVLQKLFATIVAAKEERCESEFYRKDQLMRIAGLRKKA